MVRSSQKIWHSLFLALRPAQWVKNLFLFLPAFFGREILNPAVFFHNLEAFFVFCLAASLAYLWNDGVDVEEDRLHPVKKLRPLAAKQISVLQASILATFLALALIVWTPRLGTSFSLAIGGYLFFNFLYNSILRKIVILDVFCLAVFFVFRLAAGSAATQVELSPWILLMTFLLALFLGFTKRRQELYGTENQPSARRAVLKKYTPYFIDQMVSVITSSIIVAYLLYTLDERTVQMFGSQHLFVTLPFVYYGIFRYLYLIHARHVEGDPVQIVLTDLPTRINLFLWLVLNMAVIYRGF